MRGCEHATASALRHSPPIHAVPASSQASLGGGGISRCRPVSYIGVQATGGCEGMHHHVQFADGGDDAHNKPPHEILFYATTLS